MNTENDIKEFGFRHISINTVYNDSAGNAVNVISVCYHHSYYHYVVDCIYLYSLLKFPTQINR